MEPIEDHPGEEVLASSSGGEEVKDTHGAAEGAPTDGAADDDAPVRTKRSRGKSKKWDTSSERRKHRSEEEDR